MTIYHMPLYKELHDRIASGSLGELKMAQMNFGSYKEYDMTNRFFNPSLAGGALLDIGVYALSFVRWFMSSAPDQIESIRGNGDFCTHTTCKTAQKRNSRL